MSQGKQPTFLKVGECLYRYSSNNVYYVVVKHQGKIIRRSLETTDPEIAKRALRKFKDNLHKIDPSAGKITIEELVSKYLDSIQYLDTKTIKTRSAIAKQFKETWPSGISQQVRDAKPSHVATWLGKHRERLSKATFNEYLRFAKKLFELAINDRIIIENPAEGIKPLKRENPIRLTPTWEQFQAIVRNIREQQFNAEAADSANFVEFLGLAGLGNSEAANLKWKDIDFITGRITVYRNKTDQGFVIPLYPQVKPFLERLKPTDFNPEGSVLKIKDAKKAITAACKRLGFPHFSHRSFRRCFVTRAIELGIDFKTLAGWQGHRDGGVLIAKTYSHLRMEHSEEMAKRLVPA
ncbi:MAG: hypothetical protein FJ403_05875 [Verrucomicrobia bacterium]|nr:hypothetical protein [Verrucomicrobiota bacterium]